MMHMELWAFTVVHIKENIRYMALSLTEDKPTFIGCSLVGLATYNSILGKIPPFPT